MVASKWSPREVAFAQRLAERVLDGLGDPSIARAFRMCVTLCFHRALRSDERAAMPAWFRACRPVHIAGPPLRLLWSKGVPEELETLRPCRAPLRRGLPGHPGAYLFDCCEDCVACLANEATRQRIDLAIAANGGVPLLTTV